MKKTLLLISISAIAAIASFVSCIEEDELTFAPNIAGYVIESGSDSTRCYTPYFYMTSSVEDFKISSTSIVHESDQVNLTMVKFNNYAWYSDDNVSFTSISSLNGTYDFMARTTNGQTYSTSQLVSFEESDTIGEIDCSAFEFDEENKLVVATISAQKEGATVGFALTPYEPESSPVRMSNCYFSLSNYTANDDGTITIKLPLSQSGLRIGNSRARICVYVLNSSGMYREAEYHTLKIDVETQAMELID